PGPAAAASARLGPPARRAPGQVLARGRAHELPEYAVKLRVAAEAGLEGRIEQVSAAPVHELEEALDAQPVSVLDDGNAHLRLEEPGEVARADADLPGEPLCADEWILIQRVHHTLDARSEAHTSELQSRENLVCRPLLEQ